MSDTPIPYKRDSSAASVSAGDVYRVGLLIKHAANCKCCRNAMIEDKENNNNDETRPARPPSKPSATGATHQTERKERYKCTITGTQK